MQITRKEQLCCWKLPGLTSQNQAHLTMRSINQGLTFVPHYQLKHCHQTGCNQGGFNKAGYSNPFTNRNKWQRFVCGSCSLSLSLSLLAGQKDVLQDSAKNLIGVDDAGLAEFATLAHA